MYLILGGYDKGAEYDELAAATEGRVKRGPAHRRHGVEAWRPRSPRARPPGVPAATPYVACGDLEAALEAAVHDAAASGDVVLLSPACASWDQYRDYEERGEHFLRLVDELRARS